MWPFKRKQPDKTATRRTPPTIGRRALFNAATIGDNLNYSWSAAPMTADAMIRQNLRTLRARSREQRANNDYVRQFVGLVCDNVVGAKGVVIQSKAIGMDGLADGMARRAIEQAWERWKAQADVSGQMHYTDLEKLVMATLAEDGEVLIRHHTTGTFGHQLELIDPERLDVDYCSHYQSRPVVFGIEYADNGQPLAYHIKSHRDDPLSYQSTYHGQYYRRIPASEINHLYITERIGQRRGIPWTATGLQRLKMLSAFEDAEVVARRLAASKMGVFRHSGDGEGYGGEGQDADGAAIMQVEPGSMENIGSLEFQAIDWKHDGVDFAEFRKAALRGIASGLRVSYNTLANDLSDVNYSSMRHGAINEREVWIGLQEWLIRQFVRPLFERWLDMQYTLGTITIPMRGGQPRPLSRPLTNYLPASYQARRWQWVDPLKEIQAKRQEIEAGLTSPQAVIREMGRDVETVLDELAEWQAELASRGLQLTPTKEAANAKATPEQSDD